MLNLVELNLRTNCLKVSFHAAFLGGRARIGKLRNHNSCQNTQNYYDNQNFYQCKSSFSFHHYSPFLQKNKFLNFVFTFYTIIKVG